MEPGHGERVKSEKAHNEEEELWVKTDMWGHLCWREVKKKHKNVG